MQASLINPARIDFVTLRLFCAVAEAGSISRGAELSRLALSAASRRLSEFEHTLGVALLQRSSQGVALTPAGRVALAQARLLCHGFEKLGRDMAEFRQGFRGQVRLWANMSALTEFLPDALATFMRRYPEVQIDVEEQPRNLIVNAVREGAADIGVIAGEVVDAELQLDALYRDQLVLVCAPEHPLAGRRRLAFSDTLDYEHIGLSHGTSLSDTTIEAAQRAGRPLLLRMQARSFDAACQMIAATLRVGVLPQLACRSLIRTLGLRAITLTDPWAQRQFFAVVKAGGGLSAAARLLHEHLASVGEGSS